MAERRLSLDQLCEAIVDCEHKTAPTQDSGIASVRTTNIKNGRIDFDRCNRVSLDTYRLWTQRMEPRGGDLILAREAPVGEVGMVPHGIKACLGQRTVLVRPDPRRLVPRYLLYLLLTPEMRYQMASRAEGSTVPHLNMSDIRTMELPPLPPLNEQQAIADILGSLDDKIELNRRMNQTLEAMARAIFKSWFIDFDPVRAKVDGSDPPGLDPATAALFPNAFQDSPLGPIPQGWRVAVLGDACDINKNTVKRGEVHGGIQYVDISSVTTGCLDTITHVNFGDAPSRARRRVQHGDTIWSCVRPNRRSYLFIHTPPSNMIVSTGFAVLSPRDVGACYLYEAVTRPEFVDYLTSNADGSAYPAVRPDHFAAAEIVIPPASVIDAFEQCVWPMHNRIEINHRESRTLSAIRDTLLPKLMAGKIRFSFLPSGVAT